MAKKDKLYVTTMYRWGDREAHSYPFYAGPSKSHAIDVGEVEKDYRGGKYWPEVVEFVPDVAGHGKVVHELKRHPAFQKA